MSRYVFSSTCMKIPIRYFPTVPVCSLVTKLCPPRLGGRAVVDGGGRGVGLSPICHFVPDLSKQSSVDFSILRKEKLPLVN